MSFITYNFRQGLLFKCRLSLQNSKSEVGDLGFTGCVISIEISNCKHLYLLNNLVLMVLFDRFFDAFRTADFEVDAG